VRPQGTQDASLVVTTNDVLAAKEQKIGPARPAGQDELANDIHARRRTLDDHIVEALVPQGDPMMLVPPTRSHEAASLLHGCDSPAARTREGE
jgi:hypothetical protein